MPYWRLFYHLVWATKGRQPILVDEAEATASRVVHLVGDEVRVHVIAVGTMPDHIHVVASIPPSLSISDVVKTMKGRSSRLVNQDQGESAIVTFGWQREYSVHSFGDAVLPRVVDYVQHQPERHARKDIWSKLEHINNGAERSPETSPEGTSIG